MPANQSDQRLDYDEIDGHNDLSKWVIYFTAGGWTLGQQH
jgi:hypothetical protein